MEIRNISEEAKAYCKELFASAEEGVKTVWRNEVKREEEKKNAGTD